MDRRKHLTASLAFCIVILTVPCAARAKIIYVDDDANAPGNGSSWRTAYKYLQDALTDAGVGEKPVEIRVAQGVYKPGHSAAHPQGIEHAEYFRLTDGMSLLGGYTGLAGADPDARDIQSCQTVLSGDLAGNDAPVTDAGTLMKDPTRNDNSNIMGISADKGRVRLEGCTVTGGSYGALLAWGPSDDNEEASVTIMDCTFSGNRGSWADAPAAGAVNMVGRGLRLVRCLFEGNAAPMGGAVKASQHVVLDSCQFIGNYASDGGAVNLGYATTINCTFVGNTAVNGGAIHLGPDYSHSSEIIGCVFRQNRATSAGALSFDGEMDIRDSLFAGNEAINTAGACYQTRGPAKLTNCILAGNRAGRSAAAWYAGWRARLEATNCTVADNRSSAGLFLVVNHYGETLSNPVTVSNCILADGSDEIQSRDVPVKIAYTCVPDRFKTLGNQENRLPWGPGNIAVDPCLADPGYWDPNGTPDDPNDDFFVEGDYHLKSRAGRWDPAAESWVKDDVTSPCIDAGDPNTPVGYEPLPDGDRVNMGAYGGTLEASKSTVQKPPVSLAKLKQALRDSQVGSTGEAPAIASEFGWVDFVLSGSGCYFQVPGVDPNDPGAVALRFVETWQDLLMAPSGAVGFEVARVMPAASARTVHLRQTYGGLEVCGAGITVDVKLGKGVTALLASIMTDASALDGRPDTVKPSLDAVTVQHLAEAYMERRYGDTTYTASAPVLMIFPPRVFQRSGDPRPVWFTVVRKVDGPCGDWLYLDARSGEVVVRSPLCIR